MDNYCYSPKPMSDYLISPEYLNSPGDYCEVACIAKKPEKFSLPLWNLFWLSVPMVDALLEHGASPHWNKHYQVTEKAMYCLTKEVESDPVLEHKLCMHPLRFLEWFKREDKEIFDAAYYELGGEFWVETVIRRALEAADRMAGELPPGMQGENIYTFIQRPRDDTLRNRTEEL